MTDIDTAIAKWQPVFQEAQNQRATPCQNTCVEMAFDALDDLINALNPEDMTQEFSGVRLSVEELESGAELLEIVQGILGRCTPALGPVVDAPFENAVKWVSVNGLLSTDEKYRPELVIERLSSLPPKTLVWELLTETNDVCSMKFLQTTCNGASLEQMAAAFKALDLVTVEDLCTLLEEEPEAGNLYYILLQALGPHLA